MGRDSSYLDSAATSQTPKSVIKVIAKYYTHNRSSVHRCLYKDAVEATEKFELIRVSVADFIGADTEEIVFTRGATESLNMVAQRLGENLGEGDEVLLSEMEHHANIVPWQEMSKRRGFTIKWIPVKDDFTLDMEAYKNLLSSKTKVVAVTHVSNVLGTINPVKEMARLAHEAGAMIVVDAAQSAAHMKLDVKDIDCDFLAFSGHKMLGPTGIGVLYGKKERLEKLEPFLYGGHMIRKVTKEGAEWNDAPAKFEAGTANVGGVMGLGAAVDYLNKLGMDEVERIVVEITKLARKKLSEIEGLTFVGPEENRTGVISFAVEGIHPHDMAEILARESVAVRGGHHCAMPLMEKLGINGTTRASFHIYNIEKDIDRLVVGIKKAQEIFNGSPGQARG